MADGSCWKLEQILKDEDWERTAKIANESQRLRKRLETARKAVVNAWGEAANELVDDKPYTTVSKIQFIAGRVNFSDARFLVNNAILDRIKRTEEGGRRWTLGPQLDDYKKVAEKVKKWKKGQVTIPPVQPEDVEQYGLRIDRDGALRHATDVPIGHIIGTVENTPVKAVAPPPSDQQTSPGGGQLTAINSAAKRLFFHGRHS